MDISLLLGRILVGIVFLAAVLFRLIDLDSVPGLNGDEAWYGIQAANLIHGRPLEWMAPSGRPLINLLFFIPVFLLQLFFEPAFWILRTPSVIAGLTAIFLCYFLFRDILGRPAAVSLSLLTATLPINIAYSRFGWDPSLIIVFSVLLVYFALRGNLKGILISLSLALAAHPAALFLMPVVITIALAQTNSPLLPAGTIQRKIGAIFLLICILLVAIVAAGTGNAESRLLSLTGMKLLFSHIGGLFSGETVYRYIVDPATELGLTDPSILLAITPMLSLLAFRRTASPSSRANALALSIGLLLSLLCGYIMFGPWLVIPHTERYGIYLVFPVTILFVMLLHGAAPSHKQFRPLALVVALSLFFLVGFHQHYRVPLQDNGGNSQIAFRTGEMDPKQVAYLGILEETQGRPVRIFAHGWWIWQPLLYLSADTPSVELFELWEFSTLQQGDYVVTFAGEPLDATLRHNTTAYAARWAVLDHARREVIAVYRL